MLNLFWSIDVFRDHRKFLVLHVILDHGHVTHCNFYHRYNDVAVVGIIVLIVALILPWAESDALNGALLRIKVINVQLGASLLLYSTEYQDRRFIESTNGRLCAVMESFQAIKESPRAIIVNFDWLFTSQVFIVPSTDYVDILANGGARVAIPIHVHVSNLCQFLRV